MADDNGYYLKNAILPCCAIVYGGGSSAPQRLATPILIFTDTGSDGFSVDWQDIANADTYNVDIATDSAFTQGLASVTGLTTSNYTATGRAASTQYYVRVNAHNTAGVYINSNYGTGNVTTAVGLVAPAITSQRSANSILVNFNNPSGGSAVKVYYSSNSSFAGGGNSVISYPQTSFEITGIPVAGTRYIRATTVDGNGNETGYSNVLSVTTFDTALAMTGTQSAGGVTLSGAPNSPLELHFNTVSNPSSPNSSQDNLIINSTNRGNMAFPDDYVGQDFYVYYAGTSYYGPNTTTQYKFVQGQPANIILP